MSPDLCFGFSRRFFVFLYFVCLFVLPSLFKVSHLSVRSGRRLGCPQMFVFVVLEGFLFLFLLFLPSLSMVSHVSAQSARPG